MKPAESNPALNSGFRHPQVTNQVFRLEASKEVRAPSEPSQPPQRRFLCATQSFCNRVRLAALRGKQEVVAGGRPDLMGALPALGQTQGTSSPDNSSPR